MSTLRKTILAWLLLSWFYAAPYSVANELSKQTLDVAGAQRQYFVHMPKQAAISNKQGKVPLVIVLHGANSNPELIEEVTGMSGKSDREGFIVVYPRGSGRVLTWNSQDCCGFAQEKKIDDIGFISAVIDDAVKLFPVDPARVYATGFSNGGMLVYHLAAKLPNKIAAVSAVSAPMSGREPAPKQPISIMIVHGKNDTRLPYEGGQGRYAKWGIKLPDKPFRYTVDFWKQHNNTTVVKEKSEKNGVQTEHYESPDRKVEVIAYTIVSGKHAWPGGRRSRFYGDEPSTLLNATDEMWRFFSRHELETTLTAP
jgi:polyhydroxybutyrate depolymerase